MRNWVLYSSLALNLLFVTILSWAGFFQSKNKIGEPSKPVESPYLSGHRNDQSKSEISADKKKPASNTKPSTAPVNVKESKRVEITQAEVIRQFPDYELLNRRMVRRDMLANYYKLFETLHLSPNDLAQLKSLIEERYFAAADAQELARVNNITGLEQRTSALQQASNEVLDSIRKLLGDDKYQQYLELPKIARFAAQIEKEMAVDLYVEGVPLSDAQKIQLAEVMARSSASIKSDSKLGEVDLKTGLKPIESIFLKEASDILSDGQKDIILQGFRDKNRLNYILKQFPGVKDITP